MKVSCLQLSRDHLFYTQTKMLQTVHYNTQLSHSFCLCSLCINCKYIATAHNEIYVNVHKHNSSRVTNDRPLGVGTICLKYVEMCVFVCASGCYCWFYCSNFFSSFSFVARYCCCCCSFSNLYGLVLYVVCLCPIFSFDCCFLFFLFCYIMCILVLLHFACVSQRNKFLSFFYNIKIVEVKPSHNHHWGDHS